MQSFIGRRWVWIIGFGALIAFLVVISLVILTNSNNNPVSAGASQPASTKSVGPEPATNGRVGEEYLALGDSVAYGVGASSPQELGYPVVFYQEYLKRSRPNILSYKNLALAGETSGSFISRPKSKSQLERAIEELDAAQKAGQPVSLITLTIGGNDLLAARNRSQAEKTAVLAQTDANLQNILAQLVQHNASGKTDLIVTTYYNPYPADSPGATEDGSWLERFNEIVKKRAAEYKVKVADFFEPVVGKEKSLTWIARGDIHPNTAGHAALGLAIWKATGYTTAPGASKLQQYSSN